MLSIKHYGGFDNLEKFLKRSSPPDYASILEKYALEGVLALSSATPVDTGKTALSWGYKIQTYPGGAKLSWTNSNIVDGIPVAILIQYGHGTRNGGYVQGRDYINPAIRPIFDKIAREAWGEVTRR